LFDLEGKVDADKELLLLNQKLRLPIFFFFCQMIRKMVLNAKYKNEPSRKKQ
jgi:hypothetical protein